MQLLLTAHTMGNCVVSAEKMQSIEERFIKETGISIESLMDRAGKTLAGNIKKTIQNGHVLFLCGKGNNGGDGITAARYLPDIFKINVVIFSAQENLSSASKNALKKYSGHVSFNPEKKDVFSMIENADVVVDCLFGFGFKGAIKGDLLPEVIKNLEKKDKFIISADISSGVDASTGKISGPAIKSKTTVAFSCAKLGHFLPPGAFNTGNLLVEDIGIELKKDEIDTFFTDLEIAKNILPERSVSLHKKTAGSVLIIAGSTKYTGAVAMATSSAVLRAGAGYVTIACPDEIREVIQKKVTEPVVEPLPSINGSISYKALNKLLELANENTVILIGPGLGKHPETVKLVIDFLKNSNNLIIIDADAINAISMNKNIELTEKHLLTPHSGEFSRLLSLNAADIEEQRYIKSVEFTKNNNTNLLLKGPFTIITNGKKTYFNTTGNSGLASAGTGDILSGLIAGLAAQNKDIFKSAVLGAFIQGLAADMAVKELTEYSLIATDLLSWIPKAIKQILDA